MSFEIRNKDGKLINGNHFPHWGTSRHLEESIEYFRKEIVLFLELLKDFREEPQEFRNVVRFMLYSIKDHCDSFEMLCSRPKMSASYILARTILETIVNTCFVAASGEDTASRALGHASQKSFRDLERVLDFGAESYTLRWSAKDTTEVSDRLESDLNEFSTSGGKEITKWTPESIQQRIVRIDEICGRVLTTRLKFALLGVYRHASEILHGTFFGAVFCMRLTQPGGPPKSEEEWEEHRRGQIAFLYTMLAGCIGDLLKVFAHCFSNPSLQALARSSDKNFLEFCGENEAVDP